MIQSGTEENDIHGRQKYEEGGGSWKKEISVNGFQAYNPLGIGRAVVCKNDP